VPSENEDNEDKVGVESGVMMTGGGSGASGAN